jgi:hypothetical protein
MRRELGVIIVFIVSFFVTACDSVSPSVSEDAHAHAHAHAEHVHVPQHGGSLIELGEHEANLELHCDRSTGTLSLYISDAHAENPVRIKAELLPIIIVISDGEIKLSLAAQASALSQETVGDSACFQITDPRLLTDASMRLRIPSLQVYNKTYSDIEGRIP